MQIPETDRERLAALGAAYAAWQADRCLNTAVAFVFVAIDFAHDEAAEQAARRAAAAAASEGEGS